MTAHDLYEDKCPVEPSPAPGGGRPACAGGIGGPCGATLTPSRNADKARALRQLLATPPQPGTNTFFFAHGGILWQATDYDSEESETFVFRAGSPPTLVAAIKMRDWDALTAKRGTCCAPRDYWGGGGAPKE